MNRENQNIFKLQNYHHGNLRYALVIAAEKMLEKEGVAEISLRKIAKLIGVSAAATYHQFDSKDDLLSVLATSGFEKIMDRYHDIYSATEGIERRLNGFIEIYCRFAMDSSHLFHLMFGDTLDKRYYPTLYEGFMGCRNLFDTLIRRFLKENEYVSDEKAILRRYWSLLQGGVMLALQDKAFGEVCHHADIVQKIQMMITDDLQQYISRNRKSIYCERG